VPTVRTLSREDKGEYLLEKFEFDNLAGATVPGYLLLPKNAAGKSPAILYCHWHEANTTWARKSCSAPTQFQFPSGRRW